MTLSSTAIVSFLNQVEDWSCNYANDEDLAAYYGKAIDATIEALELEDDPRSSDSGHLPLVAFARTHFNSDPLI